MLPRRLSLRSPDAEFQCNFSIIGLTRSKGRFKSEASVYWLLKGHGLITSPALIELKPADRFANPTPPLIFVGLLIRSM